MPLIIPANSITGGYEVDNSLRFDDGSSDYLSKTASAGDRRQTTISVWVKRSTLGTSQKIYNHYNSTDSEFTFYFDSNDKFNVNSYESEHQLLLTTNRLFRDVSAWYNIICAIDTDQATDTNRAKIYVNGVQETSFSTATYPSQNADLNLNRSTSYSDQIGRRGNGSEYFDGYMAEVCLIDGQQLDPTSFGEFDEDTGIWKPISVSGLTFGTNGFYLDFEDSAALGDDVSGNGNNFTVNNLTSIDQTTDTPTNNFATMNALVPATSVSFSNGNLTFTGARSGNWSSGVSTIALNSGKWYAEFKMDSTGGLRMVAVEPAENISDYNDNHGGHTADGRGYEDSNGYLNTNGGSSSWGDTYGNGDIIGVALDMDNRYVYFSKNGVFQNSGVPTSGASGTGSAGSQLANKAYYFVLSGHESSGNTIIQSNFGNPTFTISSGNSDGAGFGNFEYLPPSGYLSLCTKNLSEVLG
jgi:hypothetical protein